MEGDGDWVDVGRVGDVGESGCGLLDQLVAWEETLTLQGRGGDLLVEGAGEGGAEGRVLCRGSGGLDS